MFRAWATTGKMRLVFSETSRVSFQGHVHPFLSPKECEKKVVPSNLSHEIKAVSLTYINNNIIVIG